MPVINMLGLDQIDDAALTAFARQVPDESLYKLNQFLPERKVDSIKYKIDSTVTTIQAAKFRSYDAETYVGTRGVTREVLSGILPPVGQKTYIGELETIMEQILRGSDNSQLVDSLFDQADQNVRSLRARMELARGDLLSDGKFTLVNENGLKGLEADFGVASTHKVTASPLWIGGTNPTPLTNELTWRDVVADDGGNPPDSVITSTRVYRAMLQSAEYRAVYYSESDTPASRPTLNPTQFQSVRDTYSLPPITLYDAKISVDGTLVRPIADNLFITFNQADLGQTQFGLTAEALALAGSGKLVRTDAPGIVVTRDVEADPVRVWVRATANAMPILINTLSLMIAVVA